MVLAKEVIVISGCSGRTGTRVAHKFADPRFLVVGLDVAPPKVSTTNFEFMSCDVRSSSQVLACFERIKEKYGSRIASIVHLASYVSLDTQPVENYENVIVKGTQNILKALNGFEVEQFLFVSSVLVYRPCEPGQKITEHWPLGPTWEFPKAKLMAEDVLRAHHGKIPLVILRRAGTYDDQCHNMPLAMQIQRIYERQSASIFFPGNVNSGQALVHLDDLADAIWLTVQRRFGLGNETTMIVAEPETVSYNELQKVIGLLCYGEECKTWAIPKWVAKFAIRATQKLPILGQLDVKEWMIDQADNNYSCDVNYIQEKLGWAPRHTFRQTLPKMIASLKENTLAWYRENKLKLPETRNS